MKIIINGGKNKYKIKNRHLQKQNIDSYSRHCFPLYHTARDVGSEKNSQHSLWKEGIDVHFPSLIRFLSIPQSLTQRSPTPGRPSGLRKILSF